jgi:hypothetical protein
VIVREGSSVTEGEGSNVIEGEGSSMIEIDGSSVCNAASLQRRQDILVHSSLSTFLQTSTTYSIIKHPQTYSIIKLSDKLTSLQPTSTLDRK